MPLLASAVVRKRAAGPRVLRQQDAQANAPAHEAGRPAGRQPRDQLHPARGQLPRFVVDQVHPSLHSPVAFRQRRRVFSDTCRVAAASVGELWLSSTPFRNATGSVALARDASFRSRIGSSGGFMVVTGYLLVRGSTTPPSHICQPFGGQGKAPPFPKGPPGRSRGPIRHRLAVYQPPGLVITASTAAAAARAAAPPRPIAHVCQFSMDSEATTTCKTTITALTPATHRASWTFLKSYTARPPSRPGWPLSDVRRPRPCPTRSRRAPCAG